jgi:hypothetical protein
LLPNSRPLRIKAVMAKLEHPGPGCETDLTPVLDYFGFGRSYSSSVAILALYLLAAHAATFWAMLLVARRERR